VEITPDSAYVESYLRNSQTGLIYNFSNELLVKNSSDASYQGKKIQLKKTRDGYTLLNQSNKKVFRGQLVSCTSNVRDMQRNGAYLTSKINALDELEDSLADSYAFIHSINSFLLREVNDSLELNEYKLKVDQRFHEFQKTIISSENPRVNHYYKTAHSINETDSIELFSLLDSANYNFLYGQYLVYQLSQENPAILIRYLDQKPENRRSLLRAIRHHSNYEQILDSVKTVEPKTAGKRKVLRQKTMRIAGYIANGTMSVTLLLAEAALIVLLFVWIF